MATSLRSVTIGFVGRGSNAKTNNYTAFPTRCPAVEVICILTSNLDLLQLKPQTRAFKPRILFCTRYNGLVGSSCRIASGGSIASSASAPGAIASIVCYDYYYSYYYYY